MGSSGPEEAIKGIVEDVKGKAKEIIGIVTNRDGLRQEGRAQQDKATTDTRLHDVRTCNNRQRFQP